MKQPFAPVQILQMWLSFDLAEELSDMRKQMKALEEKNVTYMKETMNLQEVCTKSLIECTNEFSRIFLQWIHCGKWQAGSVHGKKEGEEKIGRAHV